MDEISTPCKSFLLLPLILFYVILINSLGDSFKIYINSRNIWKLIRGVYKSERESEMEREEIWYGGKWWHIFLTFFHFRIFRARHKIYCRFHKAQKGKKRCVCVSLCLWKLHRGNTILYILWVREREREREERWYNDGVAFSLSLAWWGWLSRFYFMYINGIFSNSLLLLLPSSNPPISLSLTLWNTSTNKLPNEIYCC